MIEPGTRVRLLIEQRGMDGVTPIGTEGTVLPSEARNGAVGVYGWDDNEFAVGWDNAEELNPTDPGWFYYTPAEQGEKWELV